MHVDEVRDDLETRFIDAQLLEAVMGAPDPIKRAKVFETKLIACLRSICVGHDPPLPHPPLWCILACIWAENPAEDGP